MKYRILLAFFGLILVSALFYAPMALKSVKSPQSQGIVAKPLPEVAIGDPNSPVKMKMHFSLDCHHCAGFEKEVLPKIDAEYVKTGKLQITLVDFPLSFIAVQAAKLAWCDGDKKYMERARHILASQEEWLPYEATSVAKVELKLIGKMKQLGMTEEKCYQCFENQDIENSLLKQRTYAIEKLKLEYAPAIYLNGKAYEGGLNYKEFKAAVDEAIKEASKAESKASKKA